MSKKARFTLEHITNPIHNDQIERARENSATSRELRLPEAEPDPALMEAYESILGNASKPVRSDHLREVTKKVKGKKKRKPAHVPGQMNETEKRYARLLTDLVRAGLVESFAFEGEKLQLAHRTTYSPDFLVILPGFRKVHVEVKGAFVFDEAKVKFKVSSRIFENDLFVWAQWKHGKWTETAWRHGAPLKGFTWEKTR